MKEQKRFIIPEDLWDTGLLEQWLEEKAAQGWFPVSFGGLRGKFEACEPRTIRFRLEPDKPESTEHRQERESVYGELVGSTWQTWAITGSGAAATPRLRSSTRTRPP